MRPESQFQSQTVVTTLRCTGEAAVEGTSEVAVGGGEVPGVAVDEGEATGAAVEGVLAACCRLCVAMVAGGIVVAGAAVVLGATVVVVEVVVTVTGTAGVAPVSPRLISLGKAVAGSALVVPKK